MPTAIDTINHKYNYELIRISEVNYQLFLRSDNPEVKMLGILANLGEENPKEAILSIVNEISTSTESDLTKNKYFRQLRIFVQLRSNVEHQLEEAMQSVTTFFKVEKDIFYRKGEKKGIEKGIEQNRWMVVENMLSKSYLSDENIAEINGISIDYVKEIRASLGLDK